jgi:hypothetical protein
MVVDMVNDEGKQVSLYSIQPSRFQFEFNPVAAADGGRIWPTVAGWTRPSCRFIFSKDSLSIGSC